LNNILYINICFYISIKQYDQSRIYEFVKRKSLFSVGHNSFGGA
jgi:hypothetical protein